MRAADLARTLPQAHVEPNGRYTDFATGTAFKAFMQHFRINERYTGTLVALRVFIDGFV